ncbi:MAG: ISC system 2Fe-2S type ferredoxin [Oxalobacter sp.]|nr:ISC system 2Fe-2S type ferredoxin [Oxalobacter sp.]
MPKVTVLPHPVLCPEGAEFETEAGKSLCDVLLAHDIGIEHACGQCGACSTCHAVIRQGFDSLSEMEDREADMLDRAWGLEPESRLTCQAKVGTEDLTVEIPRYTRNLVSERG